jgi:hypothetical protein
LSYALTSLSFSIMQALTTQRFSRPRCATGDAA